MAKGKAKTPARKGPRTVGELQLQDAPLAELSRDQLSVFLFVALTPEETRAIVKERKLGIPGFRSGSLGDVERCDVIADEIRENPPAASAVLDALATAFERPPFPRIALGEDGAADLLDVGGGDAALALALWRVLSDRSADVRRAALPLLDELAVHYFGTGEGAAPPSGPGSRPGRRSGGPGRSPRGGAGPGRGASPGGRGRRRRPAPRRLASGAEEQREKLQAALREARARESRAVEESARAQDAEAVARQELARARAEADALRASDARGRGPPGPRRGPRAGRKGGSPGGEARARPGAGAGARCGAGAGSERARAGRGARSPGQPRRRSRTGSDAETWLFPVYTREFYDSLEGWDRRILRAAFKQAHLLALDHRHPSLRAIPLEGLPGYYRVRVATDVRLIYRRAGAPEHRGDPLAHRSGGSRPVHPAGEDARLGATTMPHCRRR